MVQHAGLGVAMGNAVPAVRAHRLSSDHHFILTLSMVSRPC